MLKLITNDDYIAPRHSHDIADEMRDIAWSWGKGSLQRHLTQSQVKRIRLGYRDTDFNSYKFRGLDAEAKAILNELKDLNKAFLEAVEREQAPRLDLDIIHFETESMRVLRANLANYGRRKAKIAKNRNTRHPNKRRW